MKKILSIILLFTIFLPVTHASVASNVGEVQSGTERGFVGDIIADIFWATGLIKNDFITAFQLIGGVFPNNIPRWDGNKFIEGIMSDNGSEISVSGDISVSGVGGFDSGIEVSGTQVVNSSARIIGDRIEQGSIDSSEIQNNTLTASDLAANSVGASELVNTGNFTMANLNVTSKIITTTPTLNNHVATKSYVDSQSNISTTQITGQISSRNISTALNVTSDVTYYAADKDTANFLCREQLGLQFGYWRSKGTPTASGWSPYSNLEISAFSTDAAYGYKRLCTNGSDCYNKKTQFGVSLYCYSIDSLPNPTGY